MLTCPGNQAVRMASMRSDASIQATSRGPPWMSTTMMEVLVAVATVCGHQSSKVVTGKQQDDTFCHGVVAVTAEGQDSLQWLQSALAWLQSNTVTKFCSCNAGNGD